MKLNQSPWQIIVVLLTTAAASATVFLVPQVDDPEHVKIGVVAYIVFAGVVSWLIWRKMKRSQ